VPNWLWRSIVGVAAAVALLAMLQWGSCTFYVRPHVLPPATENGEGRLTGCEDSSGRSIAALMALLTTLISLSRQAKDE
jgi:hypothetical protein